MLMRPSSYPSSSPPLYPAMMLSEYFAEYCEASRPFVLSPGTKDALKARYLRSNSEWCESRVSLVSLCACACSKTDEHMISKISAVDAVCRKVFIKIR